MSKILVWLYQTHAYSKIKSTILLKRQKIWSPWFSVPSNHSAMTTLYKVLVVPVFEYCSVLCCPTSPELIQMLELIQWSFLRKFANRSDYWDCLQNMKIYSLEKWRERYRIIYVCKILKGLVPNINGKVKATQSDRRGRCCSIPSINNTGKLDTFYRSNVAVHGAKLLNAMPKHIRDATNNPIKKLKKIAWLPPCTSAGPTPPPRLHVKKANHI